MEPEVKMKMDKFCKIVYGDSLLLSKDILDNSIDLVITSPPYADATSYGKKVNVFSPDKYVDWILPLFKEIYRILKPSGSFILNINDKISNKERSIYVYDLICRVVRETNLKFYDRYIWAKKSGLLNGRNKRLDDKVEYIFHFVKDVNEMVCYMDEVREPYAQVTLNRLKTPIGVHDEIDNKGITKTKLKKIEPNPKGKIPNTIFRFNTSGVLKSKTSGKHPAQFNPELPLWFIKWLTKENDLVFDPFLGGGTVAKVCIETTRNFVGFEINESYKELIESAVSEVYDK
jgi:site-specific DNA-methyltransferase (adenine-specific)/site-specific DNA-methyltransferase (cytosine-N4-specific)